MDLPKQVKDIAGQKFSRVTVLRYSRSAKTKSGAIARWFCRCDCGVEFEVAGSSLRRGNTKSCGCYEREVTIRRNLKHGEATRARKSPEYNCWVNMRARCYNPNATRYELYGGRGITVCDRWLNGEGGKSGFECFLEDMGRRPTAKHSIDREDNDLNYEPANCRWAVQTTQVRNSRHNTIIDTPSGKMPMSQAAEIFDLPYGRLRSRLRYGWSDQRSFSTPPRQAETILVRGENVTLARAAELGSLGIRGIKKRLDQGWSPEDAVFKPKQKTGPKPASAKLPILS